MKTTNKVLTVGFPIYDGVTLVDFCGATEVFSFPAGPDNAFKPIWLAAEKKQILTSEGLYVYPNYSFKEKHPPIDILFIPGGGSDLIANAMFDKAFQDFVKKTAASATWVGSVCTGAFILAASGYLNNCSATTHWSQIDNLKLLSKKLKLKVPKGNPRGVIDMKRKIFTGGGISSSLDLALMLVEKIKGKTYAQSSQLFIQYAPNPPVHAGDPEQAPKKLLQQIIKDTASYSEQYTKAVEKLLQQL
jgi:cyclohexyl-isocyanide hydratase